MPSGVFSNPIERAKKISLSNRGKKKTLEHRRKLSESHKGKKLSEEHKLKISSSLRKSINKRSLYKGELAGKIPKHRWVNVYKGKPRYCEHCKRTDRKRYDWSNIDHKYRRNLDDYIRLCSSCHKKYDYKFLSINHRKKCQLCGRLFTTRTPIHQKFCSRKCNQKYHNNINNNKRRMKRLDSVLSWF